MRGLQRTLNSAVEPGLNGTCTSHPEARPCWNNSLPSLPADNPMGAGSVQSSIHESHKDIPWWTSVNKNIPNIIATVHGHDHGNEWCARDPDSQVVLCFNKHTGYGGYSNKGWGHGVSSLLFVLLLGSSFLGDVGLAWIEPGWNGRRGMAWLPADFHSKHKPMQPLQWWVTAARYPPLPLLMRPEFRTHVFSASWIHPGCHWFPYLFLISPIYTSTHTDKPSPHFQFLPLTSMSGRSPHVYRLPDSNHIPSYLSPRTSLTLPVRTSSDHSGTYIRTLTHAEASDIYQDGKRHNTCRHRT